MPFAASSDFCDKPPQRGATLAKMDVGKSEVGQRIRDAAQAKGLPTPAALHQRFIEETTNRSLRQTVTRQTVSNWWHGKVYPSMDMLPILAQVLGSEQEWLLFGSKRNEQLRKERQYLARISEEEGQLITAFREANKAGQKTMLRQAKVIAEEQPAPEATVHPMRRKDDKLKP
jgi:transcriptional regulator with XRE-family HTH domain